jgi:hypothetical protein
MTARLDRGRPKGAGRRGGVRGAAAGSAAVVTADGAERAVDLSVVTVASNTFALQEANGVDNAGDLAEIVPAKVAPICTPSFCF